MIFDMYIVGYQPTNKSHKIKVRQYTISVHMMQLRSCSLDKGNANDTILTFTLLINKDLWR